MTGLKLLFGRYFSHRKILVGTAAFFVLMMAVVMLLHEDPGGEPDDYIMCKFSALVPAMLAVILPTMFMIQDTVGNRFMRSVPCAKSLYMRGIPAYSTLVPLGWSVLTNVVYAAFILITGRDICNISDMLVLSAIFGAVFSLVCCLALSLRFGAAFFVMFYLPFMLTLFIGGNGLSMFGFPLWVSLLIYCGSFLAAFAAGLVISGLAYTKGNFRENTNAQINGCN